MQRCALSEDDERQLQEYVESKGMIFISTPFSRAAADRLQRHERAGLQDRLRRVQQLPAAEAHRVVRQADHSQHRHEHDRERRARRSRSSRAPRVPYALLHTTNLYPTPPHLVRLGAMVELGKAFPRRGDRPVRSHHRQRRVPRRRRARRVDPRAPLHRSHVSRRVPTSSARWTRQRVPRADRVERASCTASSAAPRAPRRKSR